MLLQDTTEDRTSGHSSFQVLHLFSGLVDVKGTNNDHARVAREIAAGDGDALGHVLGDNVDVVAKLSRDGDDGRLLGDSALDESLDVIVLLEGRALFDKIDFVLKDDDVLQFHDFHSSKMLCSLGLRTRFIASDEQERSIHNGSTVKHRSHKNVVPGTINERNMAKQLPLPLRRRFVQRSWTSLDFVLALSVTWLSKGQNHALLIVKEGRRAERPVVARFLVRGIDALVDLRVGITQLDGDVTLELVLETNGHHAGQSLDNR
mmetsp:Transcript_10120/g.33740  ORF Transcript_10120/g.33740 Transcript_10120/m.33740 type:complete len:262 (-) Transcript_10120:1289-2074(-)